MHEPVSSPQTAEDTDTAEVAHAPRAAAVRIPLQILAGCAVVVMLQYAGPVLLPVVMALLLFYALDPIVDRLEKWRLPRLAASFMVVVMLVTSVTAGAYALWPQI